MTTQVWIEAVAEKQDELKASSMRFIPGISNAGLRAYPNTQTVGWAMPTVVELWEL